MGLTPIFHILPSVLVKQEIMLAYSTTATVSLLDPPLILLGVVLLKSGINIRSLGSRVLVYPRFLLSIFPLSLI